MTTDPADRILEQLAAEAGAIPALGTAGVDADDLDALIRYVLDLGATEEEVVAAARRLGIGPLALDLAIRPPGAPLRLDAFAEQEGLDVGLARRIWRAFGLPDSDDLPVTPDAGEAIKVIGVLAMAVGEEATLGFARVLGTSMAQVADALANLTRVGVEVPHRTTGTPYSEVVREYTTVARDLLPTLWDAAGAVFRRHLVHVSYQQWSPDEAGVAVTVDRTVGFVDLVGSTEVQRGLSVAALAALVNDFEQVVWELVGEVEGRLVKLIGDEAMFVVDDPVKACRLALALVATSPHPVRVGLAHGAVVAFHGDYYGPTVSLAARLVGAAAPSSVMVSETVRLPAEGQFRFDRVEGLPLRGFPDVSVAYALHPLG